MAASSNTHRIADPRCRQRRAAFTFIEILITTAVVAIGLLALVGVLGYSVRASRTGEMASLAMGHSVHVIELIRGRNLGFSSGPVPPSSFSGINDPPAARKAMNDAPFQTDFPPDMPFRRNISITRMGSAGDYNYNVINIVCTITWQENGEDRSVSLEAQHRRP